MDLVLEHLTVVLVSDLFLDFIWIKHEMYCAPYFLKLLNVLAWVYFHVRKTLLKCWSKWTDGCGFFLLFSPSDHVSPGIWQTAGRSRHHSGWCCLVQNGDWADETSCAEGCAHDGSLWQQGEVGEGGGWGGAPGLCLWWFSASFSAFKNKTKTKLYIDPF